VRGDDLHLSTWVRVPDSLLLFVMKREPIDDNGRVGFERWTTTFGDALVNVRDGVAYVLDIETDWLNPPLTAMTWIAPTPVDVDAERRARTFAPTTQKQIDAEKVENRIWDERLRVAGIIQ
jgi:hypothetical protein